jgi:hypothetical protein
MQRKNCTVCGSPANISLCFLASTVGQSPRMQGAAKAILFCKACLEASVRGRHPKGLSGVQQRVSEALSTLAFGSAPVPAPSNRVIVTGLERRAG